MNRVRIASILLGLALATTAFANNKKEPIRIEVVDTTTLTQYKDSRNQGGLANRLAGRQTLTDTTVMNAIINGEHVKLDCYEHRKGCATVGPGVYDGMIDRDSIWLTFELPLTHKRVSNHYVVRGSW
jgi:hypothetical protein